MSSLLPQRDSGFPEGLIIYKSPELPGPWNRDASRVPH